MDFGSARQTRNPRGEGKIEPQTLTNFVSPGYAPIEQYTGKSDRQGPWTDIYGMGATLYRAIMGEMPLASIDRSETIVHDEKDAYIPASNMKDGNYSEKFLRAVDHALAFKIQDRPQTISEWQKEFSITDDDIDTIPVADAQAEASHDVATQKLDQPEQATVKITDEMKEETEKIVDDEKTLPLSSQVTNKSVFTNRKYQIAAVVSLTIIGAVVFLPGDEEKSPIKKEPVAAVEVGEADAVEAIPEEDVIIEDSIDAENQQKIQKLLSLAEEDIKALRLTNPKENNALDKYLAVLKLDENNEDAVAGIQTVSDKYVSLAYGAIESNKLDKAERYLAKAEKITPYSERIKNAQTSLQAKKEEQATAVASEVTETPPEEIQEEASSEQVDEEEEGLWDGMKQWYEKQAKKEAQPVEDSTGDKFKNTLGGGGR